MPTIENFHKGMCTGYATVFDTLPNQNDRQRHSPRFACVINFDKHQMYTLCIPKRITDFGAFRATVLINFKTEEGN